MTSETAYRHKITAGVVQVTKNPLPHLLKEVERCNADLAGIPRRHEELDEEAAQLRDERAALYADIEALERST